MQTRTGQKKGTHLSNRIAKFSRSLLIVCGLVVTAQIAHAQPSRAVEQSLPPQVQPYVRAAWQPVSLRAAPPREMEIVRSVYSGYLAANRDLVVQTALVDLQGNGRASILVRFSSSAGCADNSPACQIALLVFNGTDWDAALTAVGRSIEIERAKDAVERGFWGALIRLDGRMVYEPSPRGFYRATAWGSGTPLVSRQVPSSLPGGGDPSGWYWEQRETPLGRLAFYRRALFIEDQGSEVRVFLTPPVQGGNRPAAQPSAVPLQVLETIAYGARLAVRSPSAATGNMPQILVDTNEGVAVWQWSSSTRNYQRLEVVR